jgi:hypothetical protein
MTGRYILRQKIELLCPDYGLVSPAVLMTFLGLLVGFEGRRKISSTKKG